MVEGATALTTNDYLPQLIIQNDFAVSEPRNGKIRAVHLMPGTIPIDLYLSRENEVSLSFQQLEYPHISEVEPLRPGQYKLDWRWTGSPITHYEDSLTIEMGQLLTMYFISSTKIQSSSPMMVVGETLP